MATTPNTSERVDDDVLSKYLQSHLIAAHAGKRVFVEAAEVWAGSPYETDFARLAKEIDEDFSELERITRGLGMEPPLYKKATGWISGQAARLDPLNPAHAPAGHPGQLELESLITAVTAKSLLWETLLMLSDDDPRIDEMQIERLHDRALEQIKTLRTVTRSTLRDRFGDRSAPGSA